MTIVLKDLLPYRSCAGIMLVNREKKVFVAKRIDTKAEAWQMPQGGIDEGEDPKDAAIRELYEETAIKEAVIIAEAKEWLRYDLPDDLIGKMWKGRYRGQEQKWFLMQFVGDDAAIDIATEHPEFSEWKWVDYTLLPDLIVPFKRELYQRIVEEFSPYFN